MTERYTVRRIRDDGSVTFNGVRLSIDRAERERDAWHASGYDATVVAWDDVQVDMKAWGKVVRTGARYYPKEVSA